MSCELLPIGGKRIFVEEHKSLLAPPLRIRLRPDLLYHPRDGRLVWDPKSIQEKLQKAVKLIEAAVAKQVSTPNFFALCCENKKRFKLDPIIFLNGHKVSVASDINGRNHMEDVAGAGCGRVRLRNKEIVHYEFYAVFDGHGGTTSAIHAKNNIQRHFERELVSMNPNGLTDPGMWNALKSTFVLLDQEMKLKIDDGSGCTALFCVRIGPDLWTANAGDCRATLLVGNKIHQLSLDAKPTPPKTKPEDQWKTKDKPEDENSYNTQLLRRGAYITEWNGVRVNDDLGTARGLNDKHLRSADRNQKSIAEFFKNIDLRYGQFKKGQYYIIVARPKIRKMALQENQLALLLLATDALFDVASTEDIESVLQAADPDNLDQCAMDLINGAIQAKSLDNITVLLTKLSN